MIVYYTIMRKKEQHKQTDLKLVDALDLILKTSSSGISVDLICRMAGVHPQTFYHHFPSKGEFFAYALRYRFEELKEKIKNEEGEETTELNHFCRALFVCLKKNSIVFTNYIRSEELRNYFITEVTQYLTNLILQLDMDLDFIEIKFLTGGINSLLFAYITDSELTIEELDSSMLKLWSRSAK